VNVAAPVRPGPRASWGSGALVRALVPALVAIGIAVAIVVFVRVAWDVPTGVVVQGAIIGGLTSLLALGLALIWRANRVLNFAAGDLGTMPATLAVLFTVSTVGLSWWAGLAIGLAAAIGLGVIVEIVIVRRFTRSPRLVLSVATIGLAQVLAAGALLLPRWFTLTGSGPPAPFDLDVTIAPITFGGADVVAVVVIPLVFVGLAMFLTRSNLGIAVRAGADRADRAATLGIPMRRLNTVVWVLATVLAFLAVYLRAGIVGLPLGAVLGPTILLRALAAAVIGRMERLTVIALAAVLLGIVEQAVTWHWQEPAYVDPVLFVVVLGALVLTRVRSGRGLEASTWQTTREVRPVPRQLARLPEVRAMRWGIAALVVGLLVAAPAVLSESKTNLASAIVIFAIIGMSLVVLTGWAGQVSLGQMAFAGIGAAVAGAVTARLHWDLSLGLLLGALVGAGAAFLIGLPALRRRGLTLAVTSLAFALMTSAYLLNQGFFGKGTTLDWLPPDRIDRTPLFGEIGLHGEARFYYLCVAGLALAYAVVRGLRRTRTGRVLVAIRENEPATESFGVHAQRTTLFAFACSGFLAAFAGALFVHQQSGLTPGPYRPEQSLEVFTMAVIGGLGSAPGALLGATYVRGADYFLASEWQILATGIGLLAVLMLFPGGLGGALADARDWFFRRVARRRDIAVTSLTTGDASDPPADASLPRVTNTSQAPSHVSTAPPARPLGEAAAMLEVRDLSVAYDGVAVLHGVDLEVGVGEIVALLGTNGAGKSTVLRAVAGLAPVTAGRVDVDGADVTNARPEVLATLGVASAPGGVGIFPSLTVTEHLRLAAWTRRGDPAATRTAADDALQRFPELDERLTARAGDLSGGQQQMLNLAMALVARPRLLLLDELSLGLAPIVVTRLLQVVRDMAATGTTVLLVEQSVPLALEVAARAYFLEKGAVRFAGPTQELLDRPDLVRAVFLDRGDTPARPAPARVAPPDAPIRLEVRGINKAFGGVVALDDISFDVHDGEILGVLGPNGAGKTTLFDVISGFLRADTGTVRLFDGTVTRELEHLRAPVRAQHGLGRSFQDARLFPALTVSETLAVACEDLVPVRDPIAAALHLPAVARSETEIAARVDELLDRFGLTDRRDTFVRELSTGTRRVLDLACVVAPGPRLLLLDEPSAGLARSEVDELAPLLLRIRADLETTLVVIEHDLALLQSVADRLLALDVGRVVATGAPSEVLHDPAVVAAYVGTPTEAPAP
jgi:ABC-type branched-subunit amino acid transport system ATPase component/ABC-type branched-subunit amino acid transport system permease subunit